MTGTSLPISPARGLLVLLIVAGTLLGAGIHPLHAENFPDTPKWLRDVADSAGKTLGDPQAPVTIVEYTDFECPYCRRFARSSFGKIVKKYVASGQVRYVVRHFPLSIHEHARPMANAAECAADQNRFWEYKYFLTHLRFNINDHNLIQLGKAVELPRPGAFRGCVQEMRNVKRVEKEREEGRNRGVSATPTLFVGDVKLEGAYPFRKIKPIIERQLPTSK